MKDQNIDEINGRDELVTDLRSLVNRPGSSDLIFNCKDGVSLHACRWLLAHRCTVFKSMLSNGMLESKLSEISLANLPSTALLSIFEFLYTGAIESYPPVNWRMGFELMSAAHFFNIPKVESIAQRFLSSELSSKVNLASKVEQSVAMDMLSIALEFEETWEEKDAAMRELMKHIGDDWFRNGCSNLMSREAVELILRTSKHSIFSVENENGASLREYLTFRKIVLWLVYQILSPNDAKSEVVREALPDANSPSLWQNLVKLPDIDGYLSKLSTSDEICDSTAVLNSWVGANVCKDSLEKLLMRHVNLSRMPPSLLLQIIHPLKIFPLRQLLMAILQAALHRPVQYCDVTLGSFSLRPGLGECIIRNCGHLLVNGMNTAVLSLPEKRSSDTCEWSFTVCGIETSYIDLGIICEPADRLLRLDEILGQDLGNVLSTRLLRVSCQNTLVSRRKPGDAENKNQKKKPEPVEVDSENDEESSEDEEESSENGEESSENEESNSEDEYKNWEVFHALLKYVSEVKFSLNASKKHLRVSFSNREAVWADLPNGNYYPIVCFEECSLADVQFKLLSGFAYC